MKHFFKYVAFYKKECILGPLFKLFEASLELCVPLVMKSIIDTGIKNSDIGYIIRMAFLLLLLGILGLAATVTAQFFSAKAAVGIVSRIKGALLDKIQSLSLSELDTLGNSRMINLMTSDSNQVQTGINLTLRLVMRSPFVVLGAMIMAFTIDVRSAITFAVAIPVLSATILGIMLVCIPLYKRVQQRLDSVLETVSEGLSGARVIRAFCREKDEIREFDSRCNELSRYQRKTGRISALMNPITYVLINLAVIALVMIGAVRVNGGFITQGAVVSLYNYMLLILAELIKLAGLIITVTKSVACEKRIEAVLDMNSSMKHPETEFHPTDASVEFCDVSLRYKSASEDSLSGISFFADSGQTVGIIGSTGSGKSTLVNLIPRFYDATEGSVKIGGVDVRQINEFELRNMIGMVPQKAMLFKGSIKENILWGNASADEADIQEAIEVSQSSQIIASKKHGIDELLEQGGKNLSGGQRQRLTVARALVRKPKILILDDSTSALDFATDAALRSAVKKLPYKPTVFIVSQRTSCVKYADIIIVLEDGRAVGIGTHDQLLENCEVYREIYDSQFKAEVDS